MAKSNNERTLLRSMYIKNFRNLIDVKVEFGERITVISGKNGTAKSTILGLVAQIFNFEKDYTKYENDKKDYIKLDYETLNGGRFKSVFQEHFRLSKEYDQPGAMDVRYDIYDAYFAQDISDLRLELTDTTGREHRAVVRNNIPGENSKNTSRKVTHPVIYLNLKRLYPIAERQESITSIDYLAKNKQEFINTCNQIIGKDTSELTSTKGKVINSSVVHGDNYDHESVSSGEDNVGQIVQALFSFKRLSEIYSNYHGGILIIDELDAGLFPYAQEKILDVLQHYAQTYNIQVIVSTHSPIIIEKIFEKSQKNPQLFKNIFLSQAHGKLEVKQNYQWSDIYADLYITTKVEASGMVLPKVNVYFEDKEAYDFFNRLVTIRNIKSIINPLKEVSMGCTNYKQLIKKEIPEFTKKSIIVFDGDMSESKKQHNIIILPTTQPPDRLLFKFLFELDANDEFWHNDFSFTKEVFMNLSEVPSIIQELKLNKNNICDFDNIVDTYLKDNDTKGLRKKFKRFYNDSQLQSMLGRKKHCPFAYFLKLNPSLAKKFNEDFINCLKFVLTKGFGEPTSKIESYFQVAKLKN